MTIDEVNALCAEIAADEAEARMNEYMDALAMIGDERRESLR